MAIVKGENSYVTIAEAEAEFGFDPRDITEWNNSSGDQKENLLRLATRMIDDHFAWDGYVLYENDQKLQWPREGVIDRNGFLIPRDKVPIEITRATVEMAYHLSIKDRTKDDSVETIGIASASGTKFTGMGGAKPIPDAVYYIIPDTFHFGLRRRPKLSRQGHIVPVARG